MDKRTIRSIIDGAICFFVAVACSFLFTPWLAPVIVLVNLAGFWRGSRNATDWIDEMRQQVTPKQNGIE